VERLERRDVPATHVWDGGAADNLFSSAENWSDDVVPKAGDDILFDGTSTKAAIVDAGFAGTVASMEIDPAYASMIDLQRDLTVTTKLLQTGATLIGAADLILPEGSVCNWFGGTWTGKGSVAIASGASLNIAGLGSKGSADPLALVGRTIDNLGTATWGAGDLAATGGVWNNQAGATLDLQADVNWVDASGTSLLNNAGTVTKSAGPGTASIHAAINDSGAVAVDGGTLAFNNGGQLGGVWQVAGGATTALTAGQFNLQLGFTFAGDGFLIQGTSERRRQAPPLAHPRHDHRKGRSCFRWSSGQGTRLAPPSFLQTEDLP